MRMVGKLRIMESWKVINWVTRGMRVRLMTGRQRKRCRKFGESEGFFTIVGRIRERGIKTAGRYEMNNSTNQNLYS